MGEDTENQSDTVLCDFQFVVAVLAFLIPSIGHYNERIELAREWAPQVMEEEAKAIEPNLQVDSQEEALTDSELNSVATNLPLADQFANYIKTQVKRKAD